MEAQAHTLACGFSHSAAIGKGGRLLVWGDNGNQQLQEHPKSYAQKAVTFLAAPTRIHLRYESDGIVDVPVDRANTDKKDGAGGAGSQIPVFEAREYKAIDVAAGPFCTFAIGKQLDSPFLPVEDAESREILLGLRKVLLAEQTLLKFFGLHEAKKGQPAGETGAGQEASAGGELGKAAGQHPRKDATRAGMDSDDSSESRERGSAGEVAGDVDGDVDSGAYAALKAQDPLGITFPILTFRDRILKARLSKNPNRVEALARTIKEHRAARSVLSGKAADELTLGDVEDFALGFLQHNVKLFLFGQAHAALHAFERKHEQSSELQKQTDINHKDAAGAGANSDIKVILKPTAIKFPRFTKPLTSVSCGAAHALVLTVDQEMYSWGAGSYGALGFGSRDSQSKPQRLDVIDHKGQKYKISQICCGKFHSMCLTSRQNIYTWGQGANGRLGHGDSGEDDQLIPKEIYTLSQRKPIFVAAGESHSAAITEKLNLFTWGNGGFGRLGHGQDVKEPSPKPVELLIGEEIVNVSCGAFHTLAVTSSGHGYAFGQNKYGKLGIHYANSKDGDAQKVPVRIAMYKYHATSEPTKDKNDLVQVCAGFNHSLSLSKRGLAYSWGYSGKGLLGRTKEQSGLALPIGQGLSSGSGQQSFMIGQTSFIAKQQEGAGGEFAAGQNAQAKQDKAEDYVGIEYSVKQVSCGSVNTLALTSTGDVYVLGDNSYGQHGKEEMPAKAGQAAAAEGFGSSAAISLIRFPFQTQDRIEYIACNGEHLFAKSALDEIYGWGRNDEGQLGVGFLTEKIVEPMFIKDLSYKGIRQISCGDNYSAALTIYGEVFVAGSLEGGKLGLGKGQKRGYQLNFRAIKNLPEIDYIACGVQHMLAISRYNPEADPSGKPSKQTGKTYAWGKNQRGQLGIGNKENQYSPQVINNTKERFKKVACGNNFSIGLSHTSRVYFWGNFKYFCNHKFTKDIEEPMIITELETADVHDIACDYKQCVALIDKGELRVWGKYLLAKQLQAEKNEDQNQARDKNAQNDGDKEGESKIEVMAQFPTSSKFNILMASIETGSNHTCAISLNRQLYVWGHNNINDRLGVQTREASIRASGTPVLCTSLQQVIDEQRENNLAAHAQVGGDGLGDDSFIDNQQDSQIMEVDSSRDGGGVAGGGGGGGMADHQQVARGEAPAAKAQQANKSQGGHGGGGAGGGRGDAGGPHNGAASEGEEDSSRGAGAGGGGGAQSQHDAGAGGGGQGAQASIMEQISKKGQHAGKGGSKPSQDLTQLIISEIIAFNSRGGASKKHSTSSKELCIFDTYVDLHVLEFIRQELHKKEGPVLIPVTTGQNQNFSLIDANVVFQKILKREESQFQDEKSIIRLDTEIKQLINKIMTQVLQFAKYHKEQQDSVLKAKGKFLGRIAEHPFEVDPGLAHSLKAKGLSPEFIRDKRHYQRIFTLLQVHPCYIVRILQSGKFTLEDRKLLLKQLYTSNKRTGTVRNNYLLISIFELMLPEELPLALEQVDLTYNEEEAKEDAAKGKKDPKADAGPKTEMICSYIFQLIFESQQTNIDTICCIACHIINNVMSTFSQSQGNQVDTSLDVTDSAGAAAAAGGGAGGGKGGGDKGGKGGQGGEKGGGSSSGKRAEDLFQFVKGIIDAILQNQILKDNAQYFAFKKQVAAQLEFIRKQFKEVQEDKKQIQSGGTDPAGADPQKVLMAAALAGIDSEQIKDKFPSLRFSEEILYMVGVLNTRLKSLACSGTTKEDQVTSLILGLLFKAPMKKVWAKYDLYLYPYLSKIKLLTLIDELIKTTHKTNITNVFHCFEAFMCGTGAFPEKDDKKEPWHTSLNTKLSQHQQLTKSPMLQAILKRGKEINTLPALLPYKNFEHMVTHSLEPDDTRVCLSKKLVGVVISALASEPTLSIQVPARNDPVYKVASQLDHAALMQLASLPSHDEMVNMKLKTRLFIPDLQEVGRGRRQAEGQLSQYVRCLACHASLLQDIAVQNYDESIVLSQYEPQDKESLVTQYCDILRSVPPINKELLGTGAKGGQPQDAGGGQGAGGDGGPDAGASQGGIAEFIDSTATIARRNAEYKISDMIQEFKTKLEVEVRNLINKQKMLMKKQRAQPNGNDQTGLGGRDGLGEVARVETNEHQQKDVVITELLKMAERKYHARVKQKFHLLLIQAQVEKFLMPQMKGRMEAFKTQVLPQQALVCQNYQFGLANRDLRSAMQSSTLAQMGRVHDITSKQPMSRSLHEHLRADMRQNVRGYLQLEAAALRKNGTILAVRLQELEPLMASSHIVLIESDDGQKVEFKLVFRETTRQWHGLCGPGKVLQEHILLNFDISPKKLKQTRAQIAKEQAQGKNDAEEPAAAGGAEAAKDKEKKDEKDMLIFEANDALAFDPVKFLGLLTQMEQQKSAYAVDANSAEPQLGKKKKKRA